MSCRSSTTLKQTYKRTLYELIFSDQGTNNVEWIFDLIMSISMNQSLEVFWDSCHSFYIFGIRKCKKSTFWVKKYVWVHFYQIEVHVFTNWSRWLKKHQTFEIWYTANFLRIFKECKKITFFENFENRQEHTLKSLYAFFFYLNMVDKNQQNSSSPFGGGKPFTTIPHFRFHCEILPINFTAFVKDFLLSKKEQCFLVIMNNHWKCQCRTADNKAYRAVQSLYPKCMLKAEFLRLSCGQRLSSC